MISGELRAKIADFGLARHKAAGQRKRKSIVDITIQAPEVLRSRRTLFTEKSDVFSFALLLWEIYKRVTPFQGVDPKQIALSVMQSQIRPHIPSDARRDYADLMQVKAMEKK